MNHTDYTQQNHGRARLVSRSGKTCAVLSQDAHHWVFPTYRHPGPDAGPQALHAAHMARCIPVQCDEWARSYLESVDYAAFGGAK